MRPVNVRGRVLDDAKSVDPEVFEAQLARDLNGILEGFGEAFQWDIVEERV